MALFKQEKQSVPSNLLRDRYSWPPFSVLNTPSFDWRHRKAEWEAMIADSTIGRDLGRRNATPTNIFSAVTEGKMKEPESISTFDPYLCELMYRWFSLPGDKILDPFAGGNVRGSVAAVLGRNYTGIDLSPEQIKANRDQYTAMMDRYENVAGTAEWIMDDSANLNNIMEYETFDMAFTCPPYCSLEVYTKDKRDLSRIRPYAAFLNKYTEILVKTTKCLKPDSFFVIVVSEVRESPKGLSDSYYVGLVPDTIKIMQTECDLAYYNELILVNNVGSLPFRAPKIFSRSRKVGRQHQNVLVFYKGDLANIEKKFGSVEVM